MPTANPFIYGGPVPPGRFIGRQNEVQFLFDRIVTGQSTAVVGEPHIGKSSLLRYLATPEVRAERLGRAGQRIVFAERDCHALPDDCTPAKFWREALAVVWEECRDEKVRGAIDWAAKQGFGTYSLERLFGLLGRNGWQVTLCMDEFDTLLHHDKLKSAEFFGGLRTLASRSGALALITASRLSIAEMNKLGQELMPYGSPFFNPFIEIRLGPLSDEEVNELLEQALAGSAVEFSPTDRAYLQAMAGGHPFLLQTAGSALFTAVTQGKQDHERYQAAAKAFYRQTAAHYDDFWRHLSPRAKEALTVLCVGELHGRVAGAEFDAGDIGAMERFEPELHDLEEQGLVELQKAGGWNADWHNWVFWHGQRWRVTSRGLVWWMADNIARSRETAGWEQWLRDKEYGILLTREEWDTLRQWMEKIPKGAISTAGKIGGLLLKELLASAVA